MLIGILALQGAFALHQKTFSRLGIQTRLVIRPQELTGISGLVLPGGESSSMLKNANRELWNQLKTFSHSNPVWGICAGAILMAKRVNNPAQRSLGVIDITLKRNAYGSQNESFVTNLTFKLNNEFMTECIFIRAPKIIKTGHDVRVLAEYAGDPIVVEQNKHIATTFHPELSENLEFHEYFLQKVHNNSKLSESVKKYE